MKYKVISWSRDSKGKVVKRNLKDICNTITSKCSGGYEDASDGLGNTTPLLLIEYENTGMCDKGSL